MKKIDNFIKKLTNFLFPSQLPDFKVKFICKLCGKITFGIVSRFSYCSDCLDNGIEWAAKKAYKKQI